MDQTQKTNQCSDAKGKPTAKPSSVSTGNNDAAIIHCTSTNFIFMMIVLSFVLLGTSTR